MHVDKVAGARAFVQVIDVLRHDKNFPGVTRFVRRQGGVGGAGRDLAGNQLAAARILKVIHADGIAGESLRACDIFEPDLRPEAIVVAKSMRAGFGGCPRAGQNEDARLHEAAPVPVRRANDSAGHDRA